MNSGFGVEFVVVVGLVVVGLFYCGWGGVPSWVYSMVYSLVCFEAGDLLDGCLLYSGFGFVVCCLVCA